ncbi:TonB-dependent receptor [Marinobacterium litorale]|jgi:iron complex outermembrane receptor protein|uniref:TonB-dependent receptor n=1 Tax=Marinobacterium litorale TaxID=404770 RepID=UPI00040412C7|nr:TonB-dependent receptor [Marinobacterium litorale]
MMNQNRRLPFQPGPLSMAIAIITLSQGTLAQGAEQEPLVVVVEGKALPLDNAEAVHPALMEQLKPATNDTASLLRNVPGVSLNGAGAVSSLPSIRGLADDRLRIKVDGMDLIAACPNHMNPPLSYLDPSNLGELKVFAGITPVSVGGDSIGGTVIADKPEPVFTLGDESPRTNGEIGAFYRSNNNAVGGNLALGHATENVSIRYSGAWSQAENYSAGDDFKTFTDTGRPGHTLALDEVGSTAYETQNHTLNLAFKAGRDLFETQLSYQDMPEQLYPNQRMDLLDNEQKLVNLAWTRQTDWGELETRLYHETVDHFMDFGDDKRFWYGTLSGPGNPCDPISFHGDPAGTCAAGMPMYSESENTGLTLKAGIDLTANQQLRIGTELQRYRLDDYWTASGGGMGPGTFQNINGGERDRIAAFAELESELNARWLTLFGLRYERVRSDADDVHGYNTTPTAPGMQFIDSTAFNARDHEQIDHNVDLTALARYRHSDTLDIELGLARKVRSPNLYERYTWSSWAMAATMNNFVGDGNGYIGDIDLDPETAYTASITFDWHAGNSGWSLRATPFITHVDDYIDAVAGTNWAEDQFNVLQYANQTARLYGLDLSMYLPLANNDWGRWSLESVINYTHGENRDTGDALYNIMPLNGRFTLTHQNNGWDNAIEWVVVDAKDDVSDLRNEIGTDGYSLLNLRTSHNWEQLRLDLGVENLFDRAYALPTGGTYTGQGRTMSMTGIPWGIAVPGMGRSAYVGVTVKF